MIRVGLLALYVGAMGWYFFPKGQPLLQGEGLRWLMTMCILVAILVILYFVLERRRGG